MYFTAKTLTSGLQLKSVMIDLKKDSISAEKDLENIGCEDIKTVP